MATADVHSRSPVTAAGGICPNSLSARPAPNCTDTIPVRIMAAGRAIRDRVIRLWGVPDWIFRKWNIRDWVIRPWPCPESLRTVSLTPTGRSAPRG